MSRGYYFAGNKTIGTYIRKAVEDYGWECEDAPEDAEAIITYFTTTQALEDAYFGDDGIIKRAAPQTLLIDLSSATPNFARELSAVAMVNDMRPVESPILVLDTSLPDAFADVANVASFVAGEKDDVEAASELLELFIGNAQIVGAAGSGQLAHAALTIQVAAQMIAAVEADALFRAVQNDPASEGDIDGRAGAASPYAEQVLSAVVDKRFAGTYTIEMFMGELAAAMAAADDIDLVLPQLESGMRMLELLAVIGGIDMTPSGLSLLYSDEDEVRAAGLDWSRASEYYSADAHHDDDLDDFDDLGDYDSYDYDSYDDFDGHDHDRIHEHHHDHECGCDHHHHHGEDHECDCGHDDEYGYEHDLYYHDHSHGNCCE